MGEKVQVVAKKPEVKRENQASQSRNADQSLSMSSPIDQVMYLQRTIGNQAVQWLIKSGALQAKLKIGQPGDRYEQEADRVADAVMRMPEPGVQREVEEEEEEEDPLQAKFASGLTGTLQAKTEAFQNKTGMPDHLKSGLENLSGMELSSVRVHHNSSKPAQINALAYTQGQDIHIGPGQEKHLPHEGWHAVQQMQGRVKPTMQAKGVSINDDKEFEREADMMGTKALQREHVSQNSNSEDSATFYTPHELNYIAPQQAASGSSNVLQRAPNDDEKLVEYPIKVPRDIKTHEELDRYAEVMIFGKVINEIWMSNYQFDPKKHVGTTVYYQYPATFIAEHGGKKVGEATRPASSNPTYKQTKGKERDATNEEIDKRYCEGVIIPSGEKIKKGEQAKIDMWNVYRDEVMNDKKKLKDLPPELKELMGEEPSFKPQDYEQLLRIAEKLKKFSPEDITVYKMLALRATDNLDLFEKSVDMFLARKEELKEALKRYEEKNKGKDPQTMQDAIEASWKGFDSSKIGNISEADQYDLAKQQAWEVTKAQLEYMKNHPGETVVDFAKTATLMNTGETFEGMSKDIAEAASGDANAWARWAGGAGAGAKLSGWLLAVGGVLYVLSWLIGVGELATIAIFMGAMLASTIVLSETEYQLRIKAASQAKTDEEFKEQVTKGAAARTNVIIMLGLLAIALAVRFVAKTYFPQTVAKISKSLARFREKVRITGKLSEVKAEFVTEMDGHKQKLIETGESAKKSAKTQADALDKMSLEEFIEKLEKGDGDFFQEASVQEGQKVLWKKLAETPEGLKAIEAYKGQLADTLRNTVPKEIDSMVKEQTDAIDVMMEKVKKSSVPDEFEQAIKDHEKFMSEEEVAKRGKELEQQTRKDKAEEALKEIEEGIKKADEAKPPEPKPPEPKLPEAKPPKAKPPKAPPETAPPKPPPERVPPKKKPPEKKLPKEKPPEIELKTKGNEISAKDPTTGETLGIGELDGKGYINYAIYTKVLKSTIRGGQVFNAIHDAFIAQGKSIKGIRGLWYAEDNLTSFNNAILDGLSPENAAKLETFTGKMAGRRGYTNVKIDYSKSPRNLDGTFQKAEVWFDKPKVVPPKAPPETAPPKTPPKAPPAPTFSKPVLGGEGGDVIKLYRYTKTVSDVPLYSYWTEWETTSVKSASRMTGVPEGLITNRLTVRVQRSALDNFFKDAGSKFVPGEGAALEYQNTKPIPQGNIESKPIKKP